MIDIELHSPNSQIVGTPFATSNTPFEYPFPTDSSSSSNGARVSHFPSPTSSSFSVTPPSPSYILPPTTLLNGTITYHPPYALPMIASDFPSGQIHLTHPKMRTTPVPPSLLKKQQDKLQQNRSRRSTIDVSAAALAHNGSIHHASSDGNLNARGRLVSRDIKS
ncbi:hypothetical protein FA13DRAFT_1453071 [Coprinellus micaceus]|uniref:Uncharacterized protein n=1 Tax=Coprinellus micaceus TaxID=71717 RepID=A0A4Y7SN06_COPMI|nr:hypothetical protein FA13DRAFT_1453071 [Coprinellus micaceus]